MTEKNVIDLENLTPQQQQNLDNLFSEIEFLDRDAWEAIDDPEKMTQEIFNGIQLKRMKVGPELEDLSEQIFLQYPDFATKYANRLEKAFLYQDSSSDNLDSYEKIRQVIIREFGFDIGAVEE